MTWTDYLFGFAAHAATMFAEAGVQIEQHQASGPQSARRAG